MVIHSATTRLKLPTLMARVYNLFSLSGYLNPIYILNMKYSLSSVCITVAEEKMVGLSTNLLLSLSLRLVPYLFLPFNIYLSPVNMDMI